MLRGRDFDRWTSAGWWMMSVVVRLNSVLKSVLVPIWSGAHRFGWIAYDYGSAVASGRFGRCCVCGRFGPLIYRRRVLTPRLAELWGISARLAQAFARKESLECTHCGSKLRGRRIAQVLLSIFPAGSPPAGSLAEWIRHPEIERLRIAEINTIDGLHPIIQTLPHFVGSDYQEVNNPWEGSQSMRSEDLTRLSYPDSSLDVVLTSETLEHVPDLNAALREIHRVLAPGGRHVFTVPVLPTTPKTFARSVVLPDGTIEDRAPRICHPGGDWGYPVFTEFGTDLPALLSDAGFETEVQFGPVSEDDISQVYVCRKRAKETTTRRVKS
jgi:SAM-dependent methyltransferase